MTWRWHSHRCVVAVWQWQGNCWQFTFPVKHLCTKINGKKAREEREKIISLILILYYFCLFPGAAPEESQFYRWLLSISSYTQKQSVWYQKENRGERRGNGEKKICKVWEKMCLQGSCISQSDTLLPPSLSLTNNRAVRYKLPCDSVWIAPNSEIWKAWRYEGKLHSIRVKGLLGWQSETEVRPRTNIQQV